MKDILRVFIADDHAVVREGLKALIAGASDLKTVGEAMDGWATIAGITQLLPDVVMLDLSMPGLSGLEIIKQIKQVSPEARILIVTFHEDLYYLREALHAGATGYVLKTSSAEDLLGAIRAVAAGGMYVDPKMALRLDETNAPDHATPEVFHAPTLSQREEEVLRLVARGYGNKEVAAKMNLSIKTVETYRARSLGKLRLRNRVDIVRFAQRRGWLKEG